MTVEQQASAIERAAKLIFDARNVIISAGAGMSVDSGLPDYRGTKGFWRAYPVFSDMGVSFEALSQPQWFELDPALAWGFSAHCTQLYDRTVPHDGYHVLRRLETAHGKRTEVFTSNVDDAFVKTGFGRDQVYECHGTFRLLQCTSDACAAQHGPWEAKDAVLKLPVDDRTVRVTDKAALPTCPRCGELARPNVLFFEDPRYAIVDNLRRQRASERSVLAMLHTAPTVVIECGSGPTVPTVRRFGEYCHDAGAAFVRINLREAELPERMRGAENAVALEMTCADALCQIEARVKALAAAAQEPAGPSAPTTAEDASPTLEAAGLNPFERLREDALIV
mmetsp:Transcript_6312/g.19861  ORF Transcript_6312/g.19861 Transcript_6312/m.19861 type:complete len:337 (-) Transcript_6312:81-1091(-)